MSDHSSKKLIRILEVAVLTIIIYYFISDGFTLSMHEAFGFDGSDHLKKLLWVDEFNPVHALISLVIIVVFFTVVYFRNKDKKK